MEGGGTATKPARKVMVVADPTRESAAALQYTLSHAIVENDTLILFHVNNPYAWKSSFGALFHKLSPRSPQIVAGGGTPGSGGVGGGGGGGGGGIDHQHHHQVDFLEEMKHACSIQQPKIKVMVEKVEMNGKDKASVIHAHTVSNGIDVLVIGQRNHISDAILGPKRSGTLRGPDTAEYLIENCKCTCVGVQRKGQNPGYVLNTKTHKNFWLLA